MASNTRSNMGAVMSGTRIRVPLTTPNEPIGYISVAVVVAKKPWIPLPTERFSGHAVRAAWPALAPGEAYPVLADKRFCMQVHAQVPERDLSGPSANLAMFVALCATDSRWSPLWKEIWATGTIDEDGNLVRINDAATKLSLYATTEISGPSVFMLPSPNDDSYVREVLDRHSIPFYTLDNTSNRLPEGANKQVLFIERNGLANLRTRLRRKKAFSRSAVATGVATAVGVGLLGALSYVIAVQAQAIERANGQMARAEADLSVATSRLGNLEQFRDSLLGIRRVYRVSVDGIGEVGRFISDAPSGSILYLSGVNFHITANDRAEGLLAAARRGVEIRFIVIAPRHELMAAYADQYNHHLDTVTRECEVGLMAILRLVKTSRASSENPIRVRFLDIIPNARAYVLKSTADTSEALVVPYRRGIPSSRTPAYLVGGDEPVMNNIIQSVEYLWRRSKPITSDWLRRHPQLQVNVGE